MDEDPTDGGLWVLETQNETERRARPRTTPIVLDNRSFLRPIKSTRINPNMVKKKFPNAGRAANHIELVSSNPAICSIEAL
jgi:hypothetical protein